MANVIWNHHASAHAKSRAVTHIPTRSWSIRDGQLTTSGADLGSNANVSMPKLLVSSWGAHVSPQGTFVEVWDHSYCHRRRCH